MNRTLTVTLIAFVSFGAYFFLDDLYFHPVRKWLDAMIHQIGVSHIITYLVSGIPLYAGTFLIHKKWAIAGYWGLNRPIGQAVFITFICTLPMFIAYAAAFRFNRDLTLSDILISEVAAAFFEELFFRAFLFGQVYRYTKLGFIPAVLSGALLFASMHLYQSHDVATLVGVFTVTFIGAVLFSWIFIEWNYNIWVPIFLHGFMNLSWDLFSVADNAFGSAYAVSCKLFSVVLIIVLTILYKKRKGLKLELNRNTIWMKKTAE